MGKRIEIPATTGVRDGAEIEPFPKGVPLVHCSRGTVRLLSRRVVFSTPQESSLRSNLNRNRNREPTVRPGSNSSAVLRFGHSSRSSSLPRIPCPHPSPTSGACSSLRRCCDSRVRSGLPNFPPRMIANRHEGSRSILTHRWSYPAPRGRGRGGGGGPRGPGPRTAQVEEEVEVREVEAPAPREVIVREVEAPARREVVRVREVEVPAPRAAEAPGEIALIQPGLFERFVGRIGRGLAMRGNPRVAVETRQEVVTVAAAPRAAVVVAAPRAAAPFKQPYYQGVCTVAPPAYYPQPEYAPQPTYAPPPYAPPPYAPSPQTAPR